MRCLLNVSNSPIVFKSVLPRKERRDLGARITAKASRLDLGALRVAPIVVRHNQCAIAVVATSVQSFPSDAITFSER